MPLSQEARKYLVKFAAQGVACHAPESVLDGRGGSPHQA